MSASGEPATWRGLAKTLFLLLFSVFAVVMCTSMLLDVAFGDGSLDGTTRGKPDRVWLPLAEVFFLVTSVGMVVIARRQFRELTSNKDRDSH